MGVRSGRFSSVRVEVDGSSSRDGVRERDRFNPAIWAFAFANRGCFKKNWVVLFSSSTLERKFVQTYVWCLFENSAWTGSVCPFAVISNRRSSSSQKRVSSAPRPGRLSRPGSRIGWRVMVVSADSRIRARSGGWVLYT